MTAPGVSLPGRRVLGEKAFAAQQEAQAKAKAAGYVAGRRVTDPSPSLKEQEAAILRTREKAAVIAAAKAAAGIEEPEGERKVRPAPSRPTYRKGSEVAFENPEAAQFAEAHSLTDDRFTDLEPAGAVGFTLQQVAELLVAAPPEPASDSPPTAHQPATAPAPFEPMSWERAVAMLGGKPPEDIRDRIYDAELKRPEGKPRKRVIQALLDAEQRVEESRAAVVSDLTGLLARL